MRIAILGGTGFIGRHLVQRLALDGHGISLFSRNLGKHALRLLPPGVRLLELDVHDPRALQAAIAGHDAAINLVGILNEAGDDGSGFRRAHVELTRSLVAACEQQGVRRLLQMSSLNAGRGSSYYLASRGEAEAAVKASSLDWTIFQPSVVFGPGDGLFCRFAALLELAPVLPLARASTKFAPVHVGDVVEAMRRCLDQAPHARSSIGQTYELYGPDVVSLADIVRMTAHQLGLRRLVLPLPDLIGRLQALAFDFVPGKPFSSDNYRSLLTDSVGGIDGLYRLGITPRRMADVLPDILGGNDDKQSRYARYRSRQRA
jgi:NADH dehydrogenase